MSAVRCPMEQGCFCCWIGFPTESVSSGKHSTCQLKDIISGCKEKLKLLVFFSASKKSISLKEFVFFCFQLNFRFLDVRFIFVKHVASFVFHRGSCIFFSNLYSTLDPFVHQDHHKISRLAFHQVNCRDDA